jgi:hypothetical protein
MPQHWKVKAAIDAGELYGRGPRGHSAAASHILYGEPLLKCAERRVNGFTAPPWPGELGPVRSINLLQDTGEISGGGCQGLS